MAWGGRVEFLVVGGTLALLATAAAAGCPRIAFGMGFIAMVLFPYTAARGVGPVLLDPATILFWLFASGVFVKALRDGHAWTLTLIDWCVLLFFLSLTISVFAEIREPNEYLRTVFIWGGPFLAGRLLASAAVTPQALYRHFAIGGLLLTPFIVIEAGTGFNMFTSLLPSATVSDVYGEALQRLGGNRAQASFGHPIALAMFLSTGSILTIALAILAPSGRSRAGWLAVATFLACIQALSLSRTGLLIMVTGLGIVFALRPRLVFGAGRPAVLAVVAVLAVTSLLAPARALFLPLGAGEVQQSQSYRADLVEYVLRPGVLSPSGNVASLKGPGANPSLDNQYIVLADRFGLVGLGGFLAVLGGVALSAVRPDRSGGVPFLHGAMLANFVALTVVALITQQQVYFWLLLGACSGYARPRGGPAV